MNNSKTIKFSGFVGIVAALLGLSAVLAATVLAGKDFSWSINALSDLGVSPVASLFNYSLILVAILDFIFTIGFVKAYANNALFYIGGVLLMLGSVSFSLVGALSKAYGAIHDYVSFGYFVLFPSSMILVGLAFLRLKMPTKGYFSIFAGIIALLIILGGIAIRWHSWLNLGFAVPEIIEAFIIAAWIIWMGASLTRQATT